MSENNTAFSFVQTPARSSKPRQIGLTSVIDKGLALGATEDFIDLAGEYIDSIKLGFGTAKLYPETLLQQKLALLTKHGIKVWPGGTFAEIIVMQNKFQAYLDYCQMLGFTAIEISDGVAPINLDKKQQLIKQAVDMGFIAISEVGRKDPEADAAMTIEQRIEEIRGALDAGAWKVIIEARESGTVGLFDKQGQCNNEDLDALLSQVDYQDLIFEAPQGKQQITLMQQVSSDVNLGNINPADVLSVECLRNGLRGDTVLEHHG